MVPANVTVGGQVWLEQNANATFETGTDLGIDNVTVNLYQDTGTSAGVFDASDAFVAQTTSTTISGQAGRYEFAALAAGDYIVRVEQTNFNVGSALGGMVSIDNDPAPDPDDDVDNDDNGDPLVALGGVASAAVTLTMNGEPITDGDVDANTNLTVDFGFDAVVDLNVTKTESDDNVIPGSGAGNLTYTITVENQGALDATGVELSEVLTLPAGVTIDSITPSVGSYTPANGATGTWLLGSLNAGASATLTAVLTVSGSASAGFDVVGDTVTVTAVNETEINSNNNVAVEFTSIGEEAGLEITKSSIPSVVVPGTSITYTITANNIGPNAIDDALVTDVFPVQLSNVQWTAVGAAGGTAANASGSGNISELVDLPVGASVTYTVTADIDPAAVGVLANSASIAAPVGFVDLTPADNIDTEVDTLDPQGAVSILKFDAGASIVAGTQVSYTIVVSNTGPSTATDVNVVDTLDANLSNAQWTTSVTNGATAVGSGSGDIDTDVTLPPNSSVTFTLTADLAADATGSLVNTASITVAAGFTDTAGANTSTDTNAIVSEVDLVVDKTDTINTVVAGETVTYTITVTNDGPSTAQTVELEDITPTGTTFASITAPVGWVTANPGAGSAGTITATKSSMDPGESATFTIVLNVDADVADGASITNTASVSTTTTDTDALNDSNDETTNIVAEADLSVTKTDSPADVVAVSNNITYTITVTNNGPSDAQNVALSDFVPADTVFVSMSNAAGWTINTPAVGGTGEVTAEIGTLAAGDSETFTLVVNVTSGTAAGIVIENTATVSSTTTDLDLVDNSATAVTSVDVRVDLSVTKTDSPDPVAVSGDLTYTIQVSNTTSAAAQNVTVSDDLPAGTTFVSLSTPGGFTTSTPAVGSGGSVSATGTIAANSTATFTLVVRPTAGIAGTTISNTVEVPFLNDPTPGNNSASVSTAIQAAVGLDFGDAPDPNYPTLLGNNGARHQLGGGLFLGATVDAEANGQPTANADGDDSAGDDEEGVTLLSAVRQGRLVGIQVTASAAAMLDAWVDWNDDGDWNDAGEQIFDTQALVAGTNVLSLTVPGTAVVGNTYARFRLSSAGNLAPTGLAANGEVEDYLVTVVAAGANTGPILQPITPNPINVSHSATAKVTLNATDAENDFITYTATAVSLEFELDQQFGFFFTGSDFFDFLGRDERWFRAANDNNNWYFIEPDGDIFEWNGGSNATFVATVSAAAHADLDLITNATQANVPVAVTFMGNMMFIDPDDSFTGTFTLRVTASDGQATDTEEVTVAVTNSPPVLQDIPNQTLSPGEDFRVLNLVATDADVNDTVTFSATVANQEFQLDQQFGFFFSGNDFFDFLGRDERWFRAANENNNWFFIEPDGDVFRWEGGSNSTFIATVNAAAHADLDLIVDAQPVSGNITVSVDNNADTLTIDPGAGFMGTVLVTVTASDGASVDIDTFTVTVANSAPILQPIPDQVIPPSTDFVDIALVATDPDGDPVTFSATINSLEFQLDQQFGFFFTGNDFFDFLGRDERWFRAANENNNWFFIEPDGDVFRWEGGSSATFIATVTAAAHADLDLIVNPTQGGTGVVLTVDNNTDMLRIDPPANFTGTFQVTVTATDGTNSSTDTFNVSVMNPPPALTPIADFEMNQNQVLQVDIVATDPENDPLTYKVEAQSLAFVLDQEFGFFTTGNLFEDFLGRDELWFRAANDNNDWYFIEPDGEVFEWLGGSNATLVAALTAGHHDDIDLLVDADPISASTLIVTEVGTNPTTIQIDPDNADEDVYVILVTVTDGTTSASDNFLVRVTDDPNVTVQAGTDRVGAVDQVLSAVDPLDLVDLLMGNVT